MQFLHDAQSLRAAAHHHHDSGVRELLRRRVAEFDRAEADDTAGFIVADAGDRLEALEAALGWPIATDLDGVRFPSAAFQPSTDIIADHGSVYELVFVLGDGDGASRVILAPKLSGVDETLLAIAGRFAVPAP